MLFTLLCFPLSKLSSQQFSEPVTPTKLRCKTKWKIIVSQQEVYSVIRKSKTCMCGKKEKTKNVGKDGATYANLECTLVINSKVKASARIFEHFVRFLF